MKKLTLETYERIIDSVYEKSKYHFNMLGNADKSTVAEYIGFYALHGGLFWSEQDGEIRGVSTAHPRKKDFDWTWGCSDGIWTAHLVWADNHEAHSEILGQFLKQQTEPVRELWTWRKGGPVELTRRKLERILSYGRRRNHNSGTCSTEVQRVNEERSSGSD